VGVLTAEVTVPSQSPLSESLLAQVRAEMRLRLATGDIVSAETILEAYPQLASDPDLVLKVVLAEVEVHLAQGRTPEPTNLIRRFPQCADGLRRSLPDYLPSDEAFTPVREVTPTPNYGLPRDPGTSDSVLVGTELAHLDLEEELGRGGMGVVYRAHDRLLGRTVALKVLRAGALASSTDVVRFYREARVAARMQHRHLVPVLEMGLFRGQHAFTMPLLTGGNLSGHLDRYRDIRPAVELLLKVAQGVAMAHQAGVVHRDLKPANVLLDQQGEPLVADFGLAKCPQTDLEVTQAGQVLGTPVYMSPEQTAGQNARVGTASDVWSLGVILYLLLTGKRPFDGHSVEVLRHRVLHRRHPPVGSLRPEVPAELEAVVDHCLEKDPNRRYPTAGDLAADLRCWLDDQPISAGASRAGVRRRLGRVVVFGLVAATLLGLAVLTPHPPAREHEPTTAEILQLSLREGRPTPLLEAGGRPIWSRPLTDRNRLTPEPHPEGRYLELSSFQTGLLELLPDPVVEEFRFRAEVSHRVRVEDRGRVGLYWSGEEVPAAEGPELQFWTVAFNERPQAAIRVELNCRRRQEGLAQGVKLDKLTLGLVPPDVLAAARSAGWSVSALPCLQRAIPAALVAESRRTDRWHQLEVVVTPEQVEVCWDGERIGVHRRKEFETFLMPICRRHRPDQSTIPSVYGSRGSLGLYVERGEARFRNVVLERVSPKTP
jgi:serine/threonine-protein kinase